MNEQDALVERVKEDIISLNERNGTSLLVEHSGLIAEYLLQSDVAVVRPPNHRIVTVPLLPTEEQIKDHGRQHPWSEHMGRGERTWREHIDTVYGQFREKGILHPGLISDCDKQLYNAASNDSVRRRTKEPMHSPRICGATLQQARAARDKFEIEQLWGEDYFARATRLMNNHQRSRSK